MAGGIVSSVGITPSEGAIISALRIPVWRVSAASHRTWKHERSLTKPPCEGLVSSRRWAAEISESQPCCPPFQVSAFHQAGLFNPLSFRKIVLQAKMLKTLTSWGTQRFCYLVLLSQKHFSNQLKATLSVFPTVWFIALIVWLPGFPLMFALPRLCVDLVLLTTLRWSFWYTVLTPSNINSKCQIWGRTSKSPGPSRGLQAALGDDPLLSHSHSASVRLFLRLPCVSAGKEVWLLESLTREGKEKH